MIAVLRAAGEDAAVPAGLAQLDDAVTASPPVRAAVTTDVRAPALASTIDQAAYRIVAEALTNARKHAPGSAVTLEIGAAGDLLSITVANTLTGPAPLEHGGLSAGTGLVSMRERALLVGGSLSAGPQDGVWRVQALLPLSGSVT